MSSCRRSKIGKMAHDVWKKDVAPNIDRMFHTNLATTHGGQRYGKIVKKCYLMKDVLCRLRLLHGWLNWKCESRIEFHSIRHICFYECSCDDFYRHMGQTKYVTLGVGRHGNFQFYSWGTSLLPKYANRRLCLLLTAILLTP